MRRCDGFVINPVQAFPDRQPLAGMNRQYALLDTLERLGILLLI
jgi:hypothetical protein